MNQLISIRDRLAVVPYYSALAQEGRPIGFKFKKTTERQQQVPARGSCSRLCMRKRSDPIFRARTLTIETGYNVLGKIMKQNQIGARLGYRVAKMSDSNSGVAYKPGRRSVVADAVPRRPDFVAVIGTEGNKEKEKGGFSENWSERYKVKILQGAVAEGCRERAKQAKEQ